MWSGQPFFPTVAHAPVPPAPAPFEPPLLHPAPHLLAPLPAFSARSISASHHCLPHALCHGPHAYPPMSLSQARVQHFERRHGTRLVDNLHPLVAVIVSVVVARIHAAKRFLALARASGGAYDLRQLALCLPVPRLIGPDVHFFASVFTAACDTLPTLFDGPCVDVESFLRGIVDRSQAYGEDGVSNAALLLMLVYVDKLYAKCPALMLTEDNAARVMTAAYAVAVKVVEDVSYGTVAMARMLGVDWKDLSQLESAFMRLLGYELHVSVEAFADAEVSFMAEALEAAGGGKVLRSLHVAGVGGLEQALEVARNWMEADHASIPTLVRECREGGGVSNCLLYTGDRKFWRTFSEAEHQWVEESELPERIIGLACGQYHIDFRDIRLSIEEDKGEWYAMAMCERDGLERYLRLRAIMLHQDLSVTALPRMLKRRAPYMVIPRGRERRDGDDFVAALGEHGARIIAENWQTALVVPDPLEEAMEDAGLELPPLPSPVWHIARKGRRDEKEAGVRQEYAEGGRPSHPRAPCTPVGSPGGLVSVDPPMFHDPDLLERIRSAPPRLEIPKPEPREPPGFRNYRLPSQQLSSQQHSHPPGFPYRPPSARVNQPQGSPIRPSLLEHNGPPGFPKRPALANNGNPPGFARQADSRSNYHPSFQGHDSGAPRRPRSVWRDDDGNAPQHTTLPQPSMESGTQRLADYFVEYAQNEALMQASMAAGGYASGGSVAGMERPPSMGRHADEMFERGMVPANPTGAGHMVWGATDCSAARVERMKSRFDNVGGVGESLFSSQPFLDQTRQQTKRRERAGYSPSAVAGNSRKGKRCGRKRVRIEAWEVGAGAGAATWRR